MPLSIQVLTQETAKQMQETWNPPSKFGNSPKFWQRLQTIARPPFRLQSEFNF